MNTETVFALSSEDNMKTYGHYINGEVWTLVAQKQTLQTRLLCGRIVR